MGHKLLSVYFFFHIINQKGVNINNSDNELIRWAKEKIRRDSKFKPVCNTFIVSDGKGPTGPTGPQGPATIEVGTTTTTEPGTDAAVTNIGTNENIILDFSIPTGDIGPTGPTDTYDYFFNKINRNYSSIIPSKYNLE